MPRLRSICSAVRWLLTAASALRLPPQGHVQTSTPNVRCSNVAQSSAAGIWTRRLKEPIGTWQVLVIVACQPDKLKRIVCSIGAPRSAEYYWNTFTMRPQAAILGGNLLPWLPRFSVTQK